ncbi:phosphotransferase [Patescibacteria group bacterium]
MDFKKANFSHKEVKKILSLYPLNFKNPQISNLSGIANNNYRVKDNDLDIAIKVYSHGQSDEEKVKQEVEAIKLFEKSGIKVPSLIDGKNGKTLQKYSGFNIAAAYFIEGEVFDTIEFTNDRMFEVGKIVAEIEKVAETIDVSKFKCMNLLEEFQYVSKNLDKEIAKRKYNFDLTQYKNNLELVNKIIKKLDESNNKQFLHKDIWPWNLINSPKGIYILDFNDWAIGSPIIEVSVALLEFSMFKSKDFNVKVAKNIIDGYKSVKELSFTPEELWETILFICYLYFPYNVIQADDVFESEIYLKRIDTLLQNRNIFEKIIA